MTNPASPIGQEPTPADRRPSGPPRGPTDTIKKTSWVVGTVTAGGDGPCYSLITDDGTQYALYSSAGVTLVKGDRVKINTKPALVRISCGPGRFVEIVSVEPVR